jgi:hypothetical protein
VQNLRTVHYALRQPVASLRAQCQSYAFRRYSSRHGLYPHPSRAGLAYTHPRGLFASKSIGTRLSQGYSTAGERAKYASASVPPTAGKSLSRKSKSRKRSRRDEKPASPSKQKKASSRPDRSLSPEHASRLIPKQAEKDYRSLGSLMENPKAFTRRFEREEAVELSSKMVAKDIQHYRCELDCTILDSDNVTISTAGEAVSKVDHFSSL